LENNGIISKYTFTQDIYSPPAYFPEISENNPIEFSYFYKIIYQNQPYLFLITVFFLFFWDKIKRKEGF